MQRSKVDFTHIFIIEHLNISCGNLNIVISLLIKNNLLIFINLFQVYYI